MISHLLYGWASATLALWVASRVLRDVRLTSFSDAIWAGALLGLLQAVLSKPLSFLLAIGTLGLGFLLWFLTVWVVNAFVVLLTSKLSDRLEVRSFGAALITALILSIMRSVVGLLW